MPVSVKRITLWRTELDNKPGALAALMQPLAGAGANLKVIMGYRHTALKQGKAIVEIYPVSGRKVTGAAEAAGLSGSSIPTLLVEGEDRPGLGSAIASGISAAGVNIAFFMAQVVGERYSAVIGFEKEEDLGKATPAIKKAARG
jgi:hypothetical protein